MLSIIIPTYKEASNLEASVLAIQHALAEHQYAYEIIFMDDDSQDGSIEIAAQLSLSHPVKMVVRTEDKGLSQAVIQGFRESSFPYVIVMDADLSHPASAIPSMMDKLVNNEADFVIGSRYVPGGQLDESWGAFRRLNSWVATLMARPLAPVSDPMSGFFGLNKSHLQKIHYRLSPIGYKIGLEVLVKCNLTAIYEHPIYFQDRVHGESKMTLSEQLKYIRHLRRLYQHRYTTYAEFIQFASIGTSGFIIDLALFLLLQGLGASHIIARAVAFWPAASWNWYLNRQITFNHRRKRPKLRQWIEFVTSSLLGFAFNVGSYTLLTTYVPFFQSNHFLALVIGVLMGLGFNFTLSNFMVFKQLRQDEPGNIND